jgi:mono/diheme cytochrome c family protein
MKTRILFTVMMALATFTFLAFTLPQDQKQGAPWEIPAEYKKMENPHKGDASLDRLGRSAYSKHCRSCHGNAGKGDGPRARSLETFPGDFSSAEFQAHTDGELYYMSIIGRDEMPNFEGSIPDSEERWAIVNYLRTLK